MRRTLYGEQTHRINWLYDQAGIAAATVVGFCIPFVLAAVIALLFHVHTVLTNHHSSSARQSTSGAQLSAADITAANAAILAYCSSDLRQDTKCVLTPNTDVTAPGFVESGITESGHYETGNQTTNGVALAKDSGTHWSVIWLGQGCVPRDVAMRNNLPSTFNICTS